MRAARSLPLRFVLAAGLPALLAACPGPGSTPAAPAPIASPPVAAGPSRIETHSFHAAHLGVDKDYVVYLPAGYDADPARRWPVVYLLHGLFGDETSWTEKGNLAATADRLGLAAIVVMPDGDNSFYVNSVSPGDLQACLRDGSHLLDPGVDRTRSCVQTADYEDYIVSDLIGHVEATWRALPERRGRGIGGFSMGGYGALVLGLRHPDVFAAVASHSGVDAPLYAGPHPYQAGKVELVTDVKTAFQGAGPLAVWIRGIFGTDRAYWLARDPATLAAALMPGAMALYLDCGTEDGFSLHDGMQYLHDILTTRGIEHTYYLGPGRHDFSFWSERVDDSLAFFAATFAAAGG